MGTAMTMNEKLERVKELTARFKAAKMAPYITGRNFADGEVRTYQACGQWYSKCEYGAACGETPYAALTVLVEQLEANLPKVEEKELQAGIAAAERKLAALGELAAQWRKQKWRPNLDLDREKVAAETAAQCAMQLEIALKREAPPELKFPNKPVIPTYVAFFDSPYGFGRRHGRW